MKVIYKRSKALTTDDGGLVIFIDKTARDNEVIDEIEIAEHPLVISCMLYRKRNEEGMYTSGIIDAPLKTPGYEILECDRQLAKEITDYYTKKYFFLKIMGVEISKFRNDLLALLSSTDTVDNELLGVAFKLPLFYNNDKILDLVFEGKNVVDLNKYDGASTYNVPKKLTFIAKVDTSTKKHAGLYHYWFKDELGNRVQLEYNKQDPMINVWDKMIKERDISVQGVCVVRNFDGRLSYQMKRAAWKVI